MPSLTRTAPLIVALGITIAGCAAPTTDARLKVEVAVMDSLTRYEVAYVLQPGDQIEVFVYRQPDFSRKSVVRSDGFISLPLLGDVKAAGKSPQDLAKELNDAFSVRLKNPEVTVIVENPPEPVVYVIGEVAGPKSLPLRQVKTVAEAIAQAGNITRFGDLQSISIVRVNKDGLLEAHTVKTSGESQPEVYMALQNMPLRANDLVVVPEGTRGQALRAATDLNTLLSPVNSILAPYFNFRVLNSITK